MLTEKIHPQRIPKPISILPDPLPLRPQHRLRLVVRQIRILSSREGCLEEVEDGVDHITDGNEEDRGPIVLVGEAPPHFDSPEYQSQRLLCSRIRVELDREFIDSRRGGKGVKAKRP